MADEDICDSPRKKVAYDPDQDPEEKRVLRQKYRVLLKDEEGKNSSGHGKDLLMRAPSISCLFLFQVTN
jgi:hypothetical protein